MRRTAIHSLLRSLRRTLVCIGPFVAPLVIVAQTDTIFNTVELDAVVIRAVENGFNVESFMKQVREDTSFHKAFLNTRYYPNTVKGLVVVRNKDEQETATLYREGRLVRTGPLAEWVPDSLRETGPLRDRKGAFRYLTVEMYDDVFFPKGPFTANNSVAARKLEVVRGSKFEKYKSELKKFMFDPGTEIASVPLIGDKLALFDPDMARLYDFAIRGEDRNGHACWVFSAKAKPEFRDGRTVIKTMETWFDQESGDVIARQYRIANSSMVLDFDITIKVENRTLNGALVPVSVHYDGDWDIPFKKRELVRFQLLYSYWQVPAP